MLRGGDITYECDLNVHKAVIVDDMYDWVWHVGPLEKSEGELDCVLLLVFIHVGKLVVNCGIFNLVVPAFCFESLKGLLLLQVLLGFFDDLVVELIVDVEAGIFLRGELVTGVTFTK